MNAWLGSKKFFIIAVVFICVVFIASAAMYISALYYVARNSRSYHYAQSPTTSLRPSPNIILVAPRYNDSVENGFIVSGKARVFENWIMIRVRSTKDGAVVYARGAYAHAQDVGFYGNFSHTVTLPASVPSGNYIIEVLSQSAKDGSDQDLISASVFIDMSMTQVVKVFFSRQNPDNTDCTALEAVDRVILKTTTPGTAAIKKLLNGPEEEEALIGYASYIPKGTTLTTLTISNGTAYADFNDVLDRGVAGSCLVSAIRAQIEYTLKQFSSVKHVIISINGRTQDVLQP